MEARLAKVWIAGLQYDECRTKTGENKYDFTISDDDGLGIPAHVLFTLRNGGGKGVFLQSIFQPLDPLTSWKNDKNKVIHFFHNSFGKPVQYTLHIVEEWQVSDTKKMMIGISICPKANRHEHSIEKDLLIELEYILFSKIYPIGNNFDIFKLPLWDELSQESLPLVEWKSYLSSSSEIELYTVHRKNDYIQLLEENGLDQHTISLMKNLNIGEGNISSFFKGATDNIGIFHDKIIPAINDKIEDTDLNNDDNLSNITTSFLETLKVAKELPILLSTIRSIEELNEFTTPLSSMFEEANNLQKSVQYFENKGQELYALLIKIHQKKLNQNSAKTNEYNNLSNCIDELAWRKENLRYIEELMKIDSLDKEYHMLSTEYSSQNNLLETANAEASSSKINVLLKKALFCLSKIQETQSNLDILEKDYDIDEQKLQLDEIKKYFMDNWESIRESWKRKVTLNYRSNLSYSNNISTTNSSINAENTLHGRIEESIDRLNIKINQYLDKQEVVVERFGEKARSFLDEVISTYESQCKACRDAIIDNSKNIKQKYVDIEGIQNELGMASGRINSCQDSILALSDKLQEQINKEKDIQETAVSLLRENLGELYVRSDYETLKNKIALLEGEQKEKLRKYRRTLLELEIDMNLIEEGKSLNIYIPNKDLARLKKLLDENQINNMYGTHFLKQCSHEERMQYLKRNPSLPFSIVVLEEGFENLDLNFLNAELFSSMIILVDGLNASKLNGYITINPYLQKISEINYLPIGKTLDLITDDYEFNQRVRNTEKRFDDVLFEVDEKEKLMTKLNILLGRIDIILSNKLSRELEKEISDLKQQVQELTIEAETLNASLIVAKRDIATFECTAQKLNTELYNGEQQVAYLYQWKKEYETYLQCKQDLYDFNERLEKSNIRLTQLKSDLQKLNDQFHQNEQSFSDWSRIVKQDFNDLLKLLGNISFPEPIITLDFLESDYVKPLSFGHSLDKVHYDKLSLYKNLLTARGNRNTRIGSLLSSLTTLNRELAGYQEELEYLGRSNWRDSGEPSDDLTVLEKISKDIDTKVYNLKDRLLILKTNIDQNDKQRSELAQNVIKIADQLKKDYPEHGAAKFEIDDVDEEREKIRILKTDITNHQKVLRKEMDCISGEIKKIDGLFIRLNALNIYESSNNGVLTEEEIINVHQKPIKFYEDWYMNYDGARKKYESMKSELIAHINRIEDYITSNNNLSLNFKNGLMNFLIRIRDFDYEQIIQGIHNYNDWVHYNLQEENEQKKKADDAVNFWVERASRRVLEICSCIDDLEKKMRIRNWNGAMFPLVKLEKSRSSPQNIDDVRFQVKQFCIGMIEKIMEKNPDVDSLTAKQLSKHINMSNIVLHILGEYPRLKIHIPTIEGPLLRGEPDGSYYKEWEVINNGSSTSSTKSGGQTLMAHFIVLSMLMRQRSNDQSWLFLVSDNPFGTMSAPELVEAVFSLLELLKVQWLVVAPPITNVHITSKFNTVYQMDVSVREGKLVKVLEKKNRKFLQYINILDPMHRGI